MIKLVKYEKMSDKTFNDVVRLYELSELAGHKWVKTSHTAKYRRCHTLVMRILSAYDAMKLLETGDFKKTWKFRWQNPIDFADRIYKDDITLLLPEEHQAEFSALAKTYGLF